MNIIQRLTKPIVTYLTTLPKIYKNTKTNIFTLFFRSLKSQMRPHALYLYCIKRSTTLKHNTRQSYVRLRSLPKSTENKTP